MAPPEFAHPASWSTTLNLSHEGLAAFGDTQTEGAGAPLTDWSLMRDQISSGLVALAGDVLVVPTFVSHDFLGSRSTLLTIRFLDVRTGTPVASRQLPDAMWFYGMRAVTVGGEPAVEVRYHAVRGTESFDSVLFDAAGRQLWTSTGRQIAIAEESGLLGDENSGLVLDGGYLEHRDSTGPNDAKADISVLDLTGRTLLTVPVFAAFDHADPEMTIRNGLRVTGGYAVVTSADPAATSDVRFTVYDLVHGARKVAEFTRPALPRGLIPQDAWGQALASCGGRLLLAWPTVSESFAVRGGGTANLTVLDLATGRTTPPIAIPSGQVEGLDASFRTLTDSGCSTAQVVGTVGMGLGVSLAVDWTSGKALWQRFNPNPPLNQVAGFPVDQPVSLGDGVVYGWRPTPAFGQPTSYGLTDGTTRSSGFSLIPVAFTSDGAPVFLQIDGANSATATPAPPTGTGSASPRATSASPPDLYPVTVWIGSRQ